MNNEMNLIKPLKNIDILIQYVVSFSVLRKSNLQVTPLQVPAMTESMIQGVHRMGAQQIALWSVRVVLHEHAQQNRTL
ncbi:hypothetical protein [Limnohabitans sp. Rim8]|uniref:hypothetical protein n=1 Tax=Limnohabitans sp. Rim8 TaxID=1100718 RepID=UPI0025DAFDD6|nr:hypothetical protein [Limnohabitans sp. Rim8]